MQEDFRLNLIKSYINNKEILDFGPGDISDRYYAKYIKKYSKTYTAVELDKIRAKYLISKGFNVKIGNCEKIKLNKKFDIIIAGDIIEHLDNPGIFLKNCKSHLKKGGKIIINTPNAFGINRIIMALLKLGNLKQHPEHTFLFTEQLLALLFKRHGLKTIKVIYFNTNSKNFKARFIKFFSKISKYYSENIMFILK